MEINIKYYQLIEKGTIPVVLGNFLKEVEAKKHMSENTFIQTVEKPKSKMENVVIGLYSEVL